MIVGVLAFQGDFAEHIDVLNRLYVPSLEVRTKDDLAKIDALIIPGGESTVIGKFLEESGMGKEISKRARVPRQRKETPPRGVSTNGLIVYGTCAGAIVLAKKVTGKNALASLGLIDITIDRNAYGTQLDSFEAKLRIKGIRESIPVSFIRAPKITRVGRGVEILAEYKGDPVLVRQGNILLSTFHTEVRGEVAIHRLFLA